MEVLHNPLPRNRDKTFAFPTQCVMLKINGAWPLNVTPNYYKFMDDRKSTTTAVPISLWTLRDFFSWLYLSWCRILILLIALTCLAQSAFLYFAWGDILTVTECGCTVLMGIQNLLRLIHLAFNRTALKHINQQFVEDIWISKKSEKIVATQCERDTIVLKMVSGLQFLLICMYVIVPLLELFMDPDRTEKPFPYKMVFPYNANNGILYVLTYFFTSLAGFGVVTTLFAEDSLFGFYIAYTCGQFRLLHRDIDGLMIDGYRNALIKHSSDGIDLMVTELSIQNECKTILKRIIHKHAMIISFCNNLELFFSPVLLVNFTISSLLICMVVFQIAAVKMNIGNLVKLFIYIVSAMSQLFILCWKGDRLIESSGETAWKLYACNWQGKSNNNNEPIINEVLFKEYPDQYYQQQQTNNNNRQRNSYKLCSTNFIGSRGRGSDSIGSDGGSISLTKDLTFAIARAQKPLCITALKFSILSLKSFTAILSTSMSYFTLLQSIMEKSD